ncbi:MULTISPECIES: CBS domain-containing protein [Salinibaculum]|uniref:CBS domain-containing protein n=1 Tax=Salinibaculum TaxID=2732368 RepID=UPI0030D06CB6
MTLETLARGREELVTAEPSTTAADLADLMEANKVGSVVVEEGDRPIGIVTDRDLAIGIVGGRRSPTETTARDLMTGDLVTADVSEGVFEVCQKMSEHGIRRMPVMDDGRLVGILTLDDLVVLLEDEMGEISSVIEAESPPHQS